MCIFAKICINTLKMKKIVLFFTLFLVTLSASAAVRGQSMQEYKPLVVEGRTWWYKNRLPGPDDGLRTFDFGLTIGKKIQLMGKDWHEVRLSLGRFVDENGGVSFETSDYVPYLIREENKKVYTVYPYKATGSSKYGYMLDGYRVWMEDYGQFEDVPTEFLLYDFSQESDTIVFGNQSSSTGSQFKRYREFTRKENFSIANSGRTYWGIKATSYDSTSPNNNLNLSYIEGIGNYASDYSYVFALPFGNMSQYSCSPSATPPVLQYVTDGDNHQIIYSAGAGTKIWEEYAGIENISADEDCRQRLYTLQGIEVHGQPSRGVYILKQGATARKITIH